MPLIQSHDIPSKTARFVPGQVNCLEKIEAGHIYRKVNRISQCTILVVSDPIENKKGHWVFHWIDWPNKSQSGIVCETCVADYGVIPYDTGFWNPNRLMTTNHRPLEEKELAEILEHAKN